MAFESDTARHPNGLYTLFFTEMWERFSYYGMRALLILYLVNGLDYPRSRALELYATYTALVYLTPIIGGYLADKWLGARRAVLVGGIVMALGHFALAVPSLLQLGLGLLIAGNGFFKPNISTMVGALYAPHDPRRDSGFTIFYMGINLGAFFAPLVCGTLGETLGWHYGFAAAGIGMLFGLAVFAAGQHYLGGAGLAPRRASPHANRLDTVDWATVALTSLCVAALVGAAVYLWPPVGAWWNRLHPVMQITLALAIVLLSLLTPRLWHDLPLKGSFVRLGSTSIATVNPRLSRIEIDRILALLLMGLFVVFFWMGFEQAGGTMNLFADKLTDRQVLGWEIPASHFQAVNPLLILVLAPLFSVFWVRLDRSRFALSPVVKQAIGMIILGVGFLVLAIAEERAELVGKVSVGWLLAVYFLHTTGELCLSPIGLSMVTKLAPARLVSLMMGLWFTAIALANYLAGMLEMLLAGWHVSLYWFLVATSTGAGVALLVISPWIRRLMHGAA